MNNSVPGIQKAVAAIIMILVAVSSSAAPDAFHERLYFGAQTGLALARFAGPDIVTNDDDVTHIFDDDEDAFGTKLFVGGRVNDHVAVELGWLMLGDYKSSATFTTTDPALSGKADFDIMLTMITLTGVVGFDATDKLSVFARGGLALGTTALGLTYSPVTPYGNDVGTQRTRRSATAIAYGGGVEWKPTECWRIRAEAESFDVGDEYYFVSVGFVCSM